MNTCLSCGKPVKNKYCGVTCQNKHQNKFKINIRFGEHKNFNVVCETCSKSFIVNEREKLFPQKNKYYCSLGCANKREITDEHKKKTSLSLIEFYNKLNIEKIRLSSDTKTYWIKGKIKCECEWCGLLFIKKRKRQRFCNKLCSGKYARSHIDCRKAGQASSQSQSENRRSKNEKYFAALCEKEFKFVKTNVSMFNGWDADVVIEDFKLAVLWNGVWHYKKITEKHSVKQVQNRDDIKINEIIKLGYKPYTIKDLGRFNKSFVENEFDKLKKYCGVEKLAISPVS